MCLEGCACTNCQRGGSSYAGTAPADCPNPNGICLEHNTLRQDVVPPGESIDLRWLIEPPPLLLAEPSTLFDACAAAA